MMHKVMTLKNAHRSSKTIPGWLAAVLVVVQLAGCASDQAFNSHPGRFSSGAETELGLKALRVAETMLGTAYLYGGSTPAGFDCSGLVLYSYRQVGVNVPRTTRDQYQQAKPVPANKLQPGDLLFFRLDGREVAHVGIYQGGSKFVHAPKTGTRVSVSALDSSFWGTRLVGAGRFTKG
jgi:cell wall-associated NlpC family hydrolase